MVVQDFPIEDVTPNGSDITRYFRRKLHAGRDMVPNWGWGRRPVPPPISMHQCTLLPKHISSNCPYNNLILGKLTNGNSK